MLTAFSVHNRPKTHNCRSKAARHIKRFGNVFVPSSMTLNDLEP